jgi:hypothetical protein
MKLKHKELVKVVYPKAVCVFESEGYTVYDKQGGSARKLGFATSAWGAWSAAYNKFSKAQKRKAQGTNA